jgi:hypothetical protein
MRAMTDDAPACARCGRPVVVRGEWYEVFERMHYLCFHLEFEHGDHDPDEACGIPGCPMAATHADYLGDVGRELREQALAARGYARENRDDGFAQGVALLRGAISDAPAGGRVPDPARSPPPRGPGA